MEIHSKRELVAIDPELHLCHADKLTIKVSGGGLYGYYNNPHLAIQLEVDRGKLIITCFEPVKIVKQYKKEAGDTGPIKDSNKEKVATTKSGNKK